MKVGKVVGAIWATRKAACLQGQTFLVVESNGEKIVAADQVGAGTGDKVLLATGQSIVRERGQCHFMRSS